MTESRSEKRKARLPSRLPAAGRLPALHMSAERVTHMEKQMVYTVVIVADKPLEESMITEPLANAGLKIESLKWAVRRTPKATK